MICWEVISRSHLHESPIPMGYYTGGGVLSHYWAEVFQEEVNGRAEEPFE